MSASGPEGGGTGLLCSGHLGRLGFLVSRVCQAGSLGPLRLLSALLKSTSPSLPAPPHPTQSGKSGFFLIICEVPAEMSLVRGPA